MTLTFSPGTDFEDITDGLEAGTYTPKPSGSTTAISHALRRSADTADITFLSGLGHNEESTVWHLPVAEIATVHEGDWFVQTSGSISWVIRAIQKQTLSRRHRCLCTKLLA